MCPVGQGFPVTFWKERKGLPLKCPLPNWSFSRGRKDSYDGQNKVPSYPAPHMAVAHSLPNPRNHHSSCVYDNGAGLSGSAAPRSVSQWPIFHSSPILLSLSYFLFSLFSSFLPHPRVVIAFMCKGQSPSSGTPLRSYPLCVSVRVPKGSWSTQMG